MKSNFCIISNDEKEFTEIIKTVRDNGKIIEVVDYTLPEKQKKGRELLHSLYLVENIRKGEIITENNIGYICLGYGLHSKYYKEILEKN